MKSTYSTGSIALLLLLSACADKAAIEREMPAEATKPSFAIDVVMQINVDGKSDDLATAGLSLEQLRAKLAPALDPKNPTRLELRREAYHQNFQSLLALSDLDGYGRLYAQTTHTNSPLAGAEYTLPVRYNDHSIAALLMLQVPSNFNTKKPCMVVTASSGSRGLYGATGVVGAWALQKGCAVATTDKGTGTGFHWLTENLAQTRVGLAQAASDVDSHFLAKNSEKLNQFVEKYPNRIATKHSHSGKKVEADWGEFVLQAVQFGFYMLNQNHRDPAQANYFTRANSLTVGAAISNGGAAIVKAAELDTEQWLDGIVVAEPNVFLPNAYTYKLNGESQLVRSLPERAIEYAIYGACASLAEQIASPLSAMQLPYFATHFSNRCLQLQQLGLIEGNNQAEQAISALQKMRDAGLAVEAEPLLMTASAIGLWESIAVNYVNSYLGLSVEDHLCQLSYAFADQLGQPVATPKTTIKHLFATSSGILPTNGLQIINDNSVDGPRSLYFSTDADGQFDYGLNNVLCLKEAVASDDYQRQVTELAFTGQLRNKPTLIVQGGSDNLVQPNQHSRAYLNLNYRAEGKTSQLRYIEIDRGQHFDAFLNYPPLRSYYTPLHGYFEQSLEIMFDHLQQGSLLPPSQRITSVPPAQIGAALAMQPNIALNSRSLKGLRSHQAITIDNKGVTIPE